MTFKQCHLGITPHCWPPAAFWELCYSAGFTCIFHHCECIWCGMRTGVNPSLAALLKSSVRCLLLNNVFPSADLYLHLKGMLIAQICKQSPNNSMERTCLLWEPSSRKHTEVWRVSKLWIWALEFHIISTNREHVRCDLGHYSYVNLLHTK